MANGPVFSRIKYDQHVSKIEQACKWLGISQGRAAIYTRLVAEFFQDDVRTQEHILAYNESSEIVYLFELWQQHLDRFPDLRKRLCYVFKKGPTLREGENTTKWNNRPRNDAFCYLVSGLLLGSGVNVVAVEGLRRIDFTEKSEADITFESGAAYYDIECKRPQNEDALVSRMRDARAQHERSTRDGRLGIIALDCSAVIRPPGTLLKYTSRETGEGKVASLVTGYLAPMLVPYLTPQLLGLILFARVAGMHDLNEFVVVNPQGKPIRELCPETILSWNVFNNPDTLCPNVLKLVAERISQYLENRCGTIGKSAVP